MRSFLASLERERVRYLLISGQACVLYGASQFTEDVDLWVRPTRADLRGLLKALAGAGAIVHKLTPRPNLALARRGHGFHFMIRPDTYIDVMARPPRVGPFGDAWARRRRIATDWGKIPVVSPEDLVLLKRTNRPSDYEAISNLVRMRWVESPDDPGVVRWGLRNTFDVDDLATLVRSSGVAARMARTRPAVRALLPYGTRRLPAKVRREAARLLALEATDVQERGRRYWLPILRELKDLRAKGELLRLGTPVRSLV